MSRYEIRFTRGAVKELKALPRKTQLLIQGIILMLADNPLPPAAIKLKGRDAYRIRTGKYRIIYSFDSKVLRILIIAVGTRGQIYKSK